MPLRGHAYSLAKSRAGNVALIFGVVAPAIALLAAGAVTYGNAAMMKSRMQTAADKAALSAARELGVSSPSRKAISRLARSYALSDLGPRNKAHVEASTNEAADSVTVEIEQDAPALLGDFLRFKKIPLRVSATARMVAGVQACLLGLERSETLGVALDNAILRARACAVYSNAKGAGGLQATGGATMTAKTICSAGGFVGSLGGFNPAPMTDCPAREDPLVSRQPPTVGPCTHSSLSISSGTASLSPGVYCGGLTITGGAVATMQPGVYVVRDGPLTVENAATLIANEAGVYLTGAGATLAMDETSKIRLRAPATGPLAGILFFEDRLAPEGQTHLVGSRDAPELLGTFYLSRNRLVVGYPPTGAGSAAFDCGMRAGCPPPAASIAATSAWTIVIARQLLVNSGVELVLNSNYFATSVKPPPEIVLPAMALVK